MVDDIVLQYYCVVIGTKNKKKIAPVLRTGWETMGEVVAQEENEVHVPPRPLTHRLDSMPALMPRSGLDPPIVGHLSCSLPPLLPTWPATVCSDCTRDDWYPTTWRQDRKAFQLENWTLKCDIQGGFLSVAVPCNISEYRVEAVSDLTETVDHKPTADWWGSHRRWFLC